MADLDHAISQALRDAVPADLEAAPYALIEEAVRTARRTRNIRRAGAGVAALTAAALALTAVWMSFQRPSPAVPAQDPVTSQLCRDVHPTRPPVHPVNGLRGDAAALCPIGDEQDGAGWVLPGAPITLERWVAYLHGGIASTPAASCPAGSPARPRYVVVIKQLDGTRTAYRSTDLACGGRVAVARYLAALAYQRADAQAATTSGYDLTCSPPKGEDAIAVAAPMDAVRAAHSAGLLCSYPVFDPSLPGRLQARDYHAVPLTRDQLDVVHRALMTSSFSTTSPPACTPSGREILLRLTSPGSHGPAGEVVDLRGTCPDVLRLDGYARWWRPGPEMRAVLTRLLPAD